MTKASKYIVAAIAAPFVLILLAAVALYLPPVQQWAVDMASSSASEATGMDVKVERVRLAFPLDLSLEGVRVTKQNDSLPQRRDTIASLGRALLDVRLWPLVDSQVKADVIDISDLTINTLDLIPQARVKGRVDRMALKGGLPVADVNIAQSIVSLRQAMIDGAHLDIALTDSTSQDTTTSENNWRIKLDELRLAHSDVLLHMPGDTLRIATHIGSLTARKGAFDLGRGLYELASCSVEGSSMQYDNTALPYQPDGQLDAGHIALSDVALRIDSLRYLAPELTLRITSATMKEKSGLVLSSLCATLAMDSTQLRYDGMLRTPFSHIGAQLAMGLNAFDSSDKAGKLKATLDASLGKHDIALAASAAGMKHYARQWPDRPLIIKGTAEGDMNSVTIPSLQVTMPTVLSLTANGSSEGFMNLTRDICSKDFKASLHADVTTSQYVSHLVSHLTPAIALPTSHAVVDMKARGADYDIVATLTEGRGNMKAKARVNIANMAYDADVAATNLNLGHFVKGMQLGRFTGQATANGQGTDVLSPRTWAKAHANVKHLDYQHYNLNDAKADVILKDGRAKADINAHNSLIDGTISLDALVSSKKLDATLITELAAIDLYKLRLADKPLRIAMCSHLDLMTDFRDNHLLQGSVGDIAITDSARTYHPDDITVDVRTDRDTTIAHVYCGDFLLHLNAAGGYQQLAGTSGRLADVMLKQLERRTIDQNEMRGALPTMSLTLHSSKDNPIYRFIKYYDVDYDEIDATVNTSYQQGITADVMLKGLATQGYQLDTIALKVNSSNDPYAIDYEGYVHNVKPNDYVFDIHFDGDVLEHGISLNTIFRDADDAIGMKLGAVAEMVDSGINIRLTPDEPVIGYETFSLNKDNYLLLDRRNRLFANVELQSKSGTGIQIYSTDDDASADLQQDITLSVSNLNIERLLAAIPYAPAVEGQMDGDLHFVQEKDLSFSISSSINTRNLVYENCAIGNLGTELVYMPKTGSTHHVDGIMTLDDKEIGTIVGEYNFNTSQVDADMTFEKFPMQIANGFVPDQIIGLDGYASGTLAVHGTTDVPDVNGELYLESASLISVPYGIKMRFDDDPIRIANSLLLFEDFQMYANNNQPLAARGSLDFHNPAAMRLDLLMRAENFLLIDSKETRRSEAYGKAYVNFFASIKGELDKLKVRGKIDVLPTTNIYYILKDSPLSNDNRMKELVTFTDLHSGEAIDIARPTVDGLDVQMNINVNSGSHIKCWLNDARNNYLDIIGEGDLKMKYVGDQLAMTGRYTIDEGEIKYSLPVIPLKTFSIQSGSYIEFTGDIMNPRLNITAQETKKASVTVNGTNRMVTFNTGVVLTKTLNDMGLEFTIEAPEDNTITDELNMKSTEERGKLAVTMLTTGMYLADGNTSTFSMNSALNSFLQSEISNIAGSALKTLDLSFGMDNSTEEDGTMHTDYSFKFAKRFWNNRLAISVGGKISTGPDVSGQNKSFFDNVEVQYRLSDVSNKYMRLFYNRSVYDYLEGYVGQYGAGFLWKKKVQTLREIFYPSSAATLQTPPAKRDTVAEQKRNSPNE